MEFQDIIKQLIDQNVRLAIHYGVVVAHHNNPKRIDVRISGSDNTVHDVRYLHSYTPQNGDVVIIVVNKNNIFCLGDLAS